MDSYRFSRENRTREYNENNNKELKTKIKYFFSHKSTSRRETNSKESEISETLSRDTNVTAIISEKGQTEFTCKT